MRRQAGTRRPIAAINIREPAGALQACQARGARRLRQQEPAKGRAKAESRKPKAEISQVRIPAGRLGPGGSQKNKRNFSYFFSAGGLWMGSAESFGK